jgi:hypothetical protein
MYQFLLRMLRVVLWTTEGGFIKSQLNPTLRHEHKVQLTEKCVKITEEVGTNILDWARATKPRGAFPDNKEIT